MSDIQESFGFKIRKLRNQMGVSQEKLAELCDLHRTYIGMIERGEKNVCLRNIQKLAIALNISLSDLFDLKE